MTELSKFLNKTGLTGASIARTLGVSTATVSKVKNGKLETIDKQTLTKFDDYINNYQKRTTKNLSDLVKTTDLQGVEFTCNEIIVASEMGVVYGKAGMGKTQAIKHFVNTHPEAILIETLPMLSGKELLKQLLEGLGAIDSQGTANELVRRAVAILKRTDRVLIIDEAENLTTNNLELIRRIHDFSKTPVVLVGTNALIQNLKGRQGELLQLSSRIMHQWEMQGLNKLDLKKLFGENGDIISKYSSDIRRSSSIFRKANRLADLNKEKLNANYIKMAAQTAILN